MNYELDIPKHKQPLYPVWVAMMARCYNSKCKAYERYGAKGIKVCEEWHDYNTFKIWAYNNGYVYIKGTPRKEHLTLDRKDPKGDYKPSNCEWVTYKKQNSHLSLYKNSKSIYNGIKRTNSNRYIARLTINGKTKYLGTFDTAKEALEFKNTYIIDNKLDYPIQEYKGEIGSLE